MYCIGYVYTNGKQYSNTNGLEEREAELTVVHCVLCIYIGISVDKRDTKLTLKMHLTQCI